MKTKVLALLLVIALLATMFAACADTTGENNKNQDQTENSAQTNQDSEKVPDDQMDEDEEIVEIVFWWMDTYGKGSDHGERIAAAINKIAEEEIGVRAEIQFMQIADFNTKTITALAGGERVDLMTYGGNKARVRTMVLNSLALELTDILPEYAPDVYELTSKYLDVYTFDGELYGVPTLRNFVTGGWIFFNKDILDQMGLTEQAAAIDSFSEFESVLAAIKEARTTDSLYPVSCDLGGLLLNTSMTPNGDAFSDIYVQDTIGDSANVIWTDTDGNVELLQVQKGYLETCERAARWMENGWIYPDSTIDKTMRGQNAIKQGVAVCEIGTSEVGAETNRANVYGAACLPVNFYEGVISSSTMMSWGIGCPITAEEPEAACKFLNLMYTNEEVMRLFVNGEEGVDYEIIDGQAKQKEGQYNAGNYIIGNNLLAHPIYGNGADFYERVQKANDSAKLSAYYGFSLDSADLELLISQITAVNDQYSTIVMTGGYTEEVYQEYISKLETAGVEEYLAAAQTQLDAWLGTK